ncbi:pectate lyase c [Fusarium mundagurra]|uniref:Pectate lyase c n=1 Tax=Fusarium mundagurra TaxID=1567541 RepID=A0A8H5Z7C2_9HYPO|nr:pectate lyase c [Fusarium mundagurra]
MPPLKPLPDCEGPKLEPFEHDFEGDDVEFLKILEPVCSAHSKIIKTRIGDKIYSIKFFVWEEFFAQPPYTSVYDYNKRPYETCKGLVYHFTPFENECRAFGRLKDVGREDLAVKVHGYVALNCTDVIVEKLQAARSKMIDPYAKLEWFLAIDNGVSLGIVKDWVDEVEYDDEDTYDLYQQVVQVSHFPRMLEKLHELHKHGIVVRDLSDRQYVNGTLVDLSMASTVPHPFGPDPDPLGLGEFWQPRWTFQSMAAWDLYCFQEYVIEAWKEGLARLLKVRPGTKGLRKTCWTQAYRLPKHTKELRPRGRWCQDEEQQPYLPMLNYRYQKLDMIQAPRHDPLDFAKHAPVVNNAKERMTGGAKGRGVKKSVAKRKQVKGKMVNKPKAPSSRYDLRSHTVKK